MLFKHSPRHRKVGTVLQREVISVHKIMEQYSATGFAEIAAEGRQVVAFYTG
jgi:hypothetical protein